MLGRLGAGFGRLGIVGGKHLAWLPLIGSTQPTLFADFTTEGTTNRYWYNGAQYGSAAAWLTASGTFARASTAYYTNSSGLLTSAASGALRFDYDPVALTPKGILLEGASTNLLTRSQLDSGWSPGGTDTLTLNAAVAPDGTTTAALLVPSTSSASHFAQSPGITTTTQVTVSFFVKAAGYTHAAIASSSNNWVYVNLTTGAIESSIGTGWTSATATQYANGWWRLTVYQSSSTNLIQFFVYAYNAVQANGNVAPTFAGDGVSGINIWGAQVENNTFSSSYIPTTTATVARAADTLTIPLSSASTLSAVAKVTAMAGFTSGGRIIGVGSGKLLDQGSSSTVDTNNGTNAITATSNAWTSANKVGVTGTGAIRSIAANNGAATTDANALLSGAITNLYVMSDNAANPSYGDLASIAVWNGVSATGTQLSALTA